ncbi:MAG: uncharacterized protein KVP18_002245 [Porospora cf. gigantea A]|uniref:uncharacterized protein n=1 Tax=Porospora cf. gigantea A TaxID=2853593 RepID=UPI0035593EA4|nr:MAG: hypothetical protein KVP18_002245 [Porospora cf. gigantea A]
MKEVSSIFGGKSVVQSKSSAEHILALKQKLRVTLKNARECPPSPGLPPPSGSQGTPPPSGSQVMAPSPSQETEVKEIKAQAKPKLLKEIKSSDIKPKDTKPKEVKPKPKEIKPKEIKPKDIKPKEIKPKEIKPKDVKVKAKAKSLVKPPVDFDGPLPLDVIKKRRLDGGDEPLQKCMRLEKSGNEVEKGGMDSLVRRLEASPSFKPPVVKPPDVPKSDFKGPLSLDSLLKLKPEGETDPLEPAALAVPMTAKPPPLKNDTVPQPPSTRSKAASRPSRTHAFPNIDGLEKQGQIQRPTPSVRLHESVRRPLPLRAIVAQAVLSSDETPGMAEVSPATPKLQPVEVDDEAEPPKKGVDVPTAPLTQLELQDVADRPEPDVLDSESRRLAAERRTARLQRTNALMRTKILSEFPLSDEIRPLLAPRELGDAC